MIAFWLLVAAFSFGNLYKFSFFSPDVHISALDIAILLLTLVSLSSNLKKYKSLLAPVAIFFMVSLLSLIFALPVYGWPAVLVGSLYLGRWIVYSLFFASIIRLFKLPQIRRLLIVLGIFTALTGLIQYIVFPDVRNLAVAEWDPHYYRVVGTFLDPGFTGIILVFTLILLIDQPIWWTVAYIAFALTYSRASYLAFLASMAYLAWKKKGWKFFVKILLLFAVTVIVLPRPGGEGVRLERTNSILARIQSWQTAWQIFTKHPILGVGFNTYRYAQGANLQSHAGAGSDSSLLFVAATTGLVGLLAYLWYLKSLWHLSYLRPWLVALLVHSLFLNSLFYPAVMVWLSLLIPFSFDSPPDHSPQLPNRSLRNSSLKAS